MQVTNVSINGIPIHSNVSDIGFVVTQDATGFEFPGIRFSPYPKPGEHGAVVPNEFYDGRTMTLNGRISGVTTSQYAQNRRTLLAGLRIVVNNLNIATPLLLKFTTLDGLNLQCYCYLAQPPQFIERSLNHGAFQLQLFAPDPLFYDQTTQNATVNIPTGGGVTYPVIYPVTYAAQSGGQLIITNSGDADTFPLVTFYGALTSPFIRNLTTGATFKINYTLLASDVLVCNMGFPTPDLISKTMVLNNNQNAMQYFSYLNTWISLQPGDNLIELGSDLSSDSGHMNVNYLNARIGL